MSYTAYFSQTTVFFRQIFKQNKTFIYNIYFFLITQQIIQQQVIFNIFVKNTRKQHAYRC